MECHDVIRTCQECGKPYTWTEADSASRTSAATCRQSAARHAGPSLSGARLVKRRADRRCREKFSWQGSQFVNIRP
jgi:hypothetical protein